MSATARRRSPPNRPRAGLDEDGAPLRLVYSCDDGPGIHRVRRGKGFAYRGPSGRLVRDAAMLARIRALAIPPAWEDVWICEDPNGHVQATGRDARGRKQYRYHPGWRRKRDEMKFARLTEFAEALPALRSRVDRDLKVKGLGRVKVVAVVVHLLERTLMRVGNDEYAKSNGSYGLTTLRDRHVKVRGGEIAFRFRGKSAKDHELAVRDERAAKIVARCRAIPGQTLFQYVDDDGERKSIDSGDVNDYLREATGKDFTAKTFRTWAGTVLAAMALAREDPPVTEASAKRSINTAIEEVARSLGNTRAVARSSYVHPEVIAAYADGSLLESWDDLMRARKPRGLAREEGAVLALLRRRAKGAARPAESA